MIVRRWFIETVDGEIVDGPFRSLSKVRPDRDEWASKHMDELVVVEREIDIIGLNYVKERVIECLS